MAAAESLTYPTETENTVAKLKLSTLCRLYGVISILKLHQICFVLHRQNLYVDKHGNNYMLISRKNTSSAVLFPIDTHCPMGMQLPFLQR